MQPRPRELAHGVLLVLVIAAVAQALERGLKTLFTQAPIEAILLAMVLGALIAHLWRVPASFAPGIRWSGKQLLEVAVVLLGASVDYRAFADVGPALLVATLAFVPIVLLLTFTLGRWLGLTQTRALLVAVGNSICGNSAIAAVAPVLRAEAADVAASIAFTAVIGAISVIALPTLHHALALTQEQYGIVAGLSVYAVPQVLAATFVIGGTSVQTGTVVKLARVLMLAPVVVVLSLLRRSKDATVNPLRLVPWFVIGFLLLAAARSGGVISEEVAAIVKTLAKFVTVMAMASLGLGLNLRSLGAGSSRVALTVFGSLVVMVALSLAIVFLIASP